MQHTNQLTKGERVAIAIALTAGIALLGHAIITGEPILEDPCHGESKAACAEAQGANTKAGYAHKGEITGAYDDLRDQL